MTKKKRNKTNNTINDSTAFSKSEWYGSTRRDRKKKTKLKKIYPKKSDKIGIILLPDNSIQSIKTDELLAESAE